jgi:hypothetical protein
MLLTNMRNFIYLLLNFLILLFRNLLFRQHVEIRNDCDLLLRLKIIFTSVFAGLDGLRLFWAHFKFFITLYKLIFNIIFNNI